MLWVWRGHVLAADASRLPSTALADDVLTVDTTLDYDVDWTHLVENNLRSPHLYWLHDGTAPPLTSLGRADSTASRIEMRGSQDHSGSYAAPNVVHHSGVNGYAEEVHVVPIARQRARVLLRQHIRKGALLSAAGAIPGGLGVVASLLRTANSRVGRMDYAAMQQRVAEEPRPSERAGELLGEFRAWLSAAEQSERPYFSRWDGAETSVGTRLSLGEQQDDEPTGTYGLKQSYVRDHPVPKYAPMAEAETSTPLRSLQRTASAAAVSVPAALLAYDLLFS